MQALDLLRIQKARDLHVARITTKLPYVWTPSEDMTILASLVREEVAFRSGLPFVGVGWQWQCPEYESEASGSLNHNGNSCLARLRVSVHALHAAAFLGNDGTLFFIGEKAAVCRAEELWQAS